MQISRRRCPFVPQPQPGQCQVGARPQDGSYVHGGSFAGGRNGAPAQDRQFRPGAMGDFSAPRADLAASIRSRTSVGGSAGHRTSRAIAPFGTVLKLDQGAPLERRHAHGVQVPVREHVAQKTPGSRSLMVPFTCWRRALSSGPRTRGRGTVPPAGPGHVDQGITREAPDCLVVKDTTFTLPPPGSVGRHARR